MHLVRWFNVLSSVCRPQLLSLLNHFDRYVCDTNLSIPTRGSFYNYKTSPERSHGPGDTGDAEVIVGLDWITPAPPYSAMKEV